MKSIGKDGPASQTRGSEHRDWNAAAQPFESSIGRTLSFNSFRLMLRMGMTCACVTQSSFCRLTQGVHILEDFVADSGVQQSYALQQVGRKHPRREGYLL